MMILNVFMASFRRRGAGLLAILAFLASWTMGGCECSQDVAVSTGPRIDTPTIVEEKPDAPRPAVLFPDSLRAEDATLNRFVEEAMAVCRQGDYDRFRQLFGTAYEPVGLADFRRVWHDVESIEILSLHPAKGEPPRYYVIFAKARLRHPDQKGRAERIIPVMVFREGEDWRMGSAPREVVERLRPLATPSASAPS